MNKNRGVKLLSEVRILYTKKTFKERIMRLFGFYYCHNCFRRIRVMDISVFGPYDYAYCNDSICRGAAKFEVNIIANATPEVTIYYGDENE